MQGINAGLTATDSFASTEEASPEVEGGRVCLRWNATMGWSPDTGSLSVRGARGSPSYGPITYS